MSVVTKTLNTRIRLRYDTLANWTSNDPVLLSGEVAVVAVPSGNTQLVNSVSAPQLLMKVGDGTSTFSQLKYASGLAADVYAWAKNAHPGDAITIDVQTGSQMDAGASVVTGVAWDNTKDVLTITKQQLPAGVDVSGKADKKIPAATGNVATLDASGNLADGGYTVSELRTYSETKASAAETAAKGYADTEIAKTVTKIETGTENGTIKVTQNGTTGNISVYGLGSAAYTASTAYDAAGTAAGLISGLNAATGITGTTGVTSAVSAVDETAGVITVTTSPIAFPVTSVAGMTGAVTLGTLTVGSKTYNGSTGVTISAADLGLDAAITFVGVSTTDPKGSSGATVAGHSTWAKGEVVLYNNKEYILTGTSNVAADWTEFGDEGSYALKTVTISAGSGLTGGGSLEANRTLTHYTPTGGDGSAISAGTGSGNTYITSVEVDAFGHVTAVKSTNTGFTNLVTAVSDPTASGNATSFIDSASQDANGQLHVTKKTIPSASSSTAGLVTLGATGGAETYGSAAAVQSTITGNSSTDTADSLTLNGLKKRIDGLDVGTQIDNKINALDVSDISGFGAGKTLATLSETDGKIAATFQDISITSSQVSDLSSTYSPTGTVAVNGTAVAAAIGTLDVSDTEVSKNIVTAVSEVDGKISVTRKELKASTGLTITDDGTSGAIGNPVIGIDSSVVFILQCGDSVNPS